MRCLPAKQARAERMERRDPHAAAINAKQRFDARAHLLRGLVGEGDGQQAIWLAERFADQVSDAMSDHAGLAGSSTGKNQQRPFTMKNGFLLFRIQSGKKIQPLYSTVTLFARFLGWSTSQPRRTAM